MGDRLQARVLARILSGLLALCISPVLFAQQETAPSTQLPDLHREFRAWSGANQPSGPFFAIRTERPAGWAPDWSRTALQARQEEYMAFKGRLQALGNRIGNTADRVDAAILGAAMSRIYWELEVLASPRRDPGFALDQSLGSIFELLIANPGPDEAAVAEIIVRLKRFPAIINAAKLGLDESVGLLADAAVERIGDVDGKINALEAGLASFVPESLGAEFELGTRAARQALLSYKDWLTVSRGRFNASPSIGEHRLRWYLGHVALIPRSPDAIVVETELVLAQTGAQQALDNQRFAQTSGASPLDTLPRLLQMLEINRSELQTYLGSTGLLTVSADQPALGYSALPSTLVPLANMGELIGFPGAETPGQRYLSPAGSTTSFRESLAWAEPRLLLTWEDLPGLGTQYHQAALNPREIRRRASSVPLGAGISLYFHEQFLKAGLYAFKPASHQLAVRLLTYHAALAQADIRIARGEWSADEAAAFLQTLPGRDKAGAQADVTALIAHPGVAAASFAAFGQVVRFLADAARLGGKEFSLKAFNDRLLLNAHVPVALQRQEVLGLEDEMEALIEQRGRPATVPE